MLEADADRLRGIDVIDETVGDQPRISLRKRIAADARAIGVLDQELQWRIRRLGAIAYQQRPVLDAEPSDTDRGVDALDGRQTGTLDRQTVVVLDPECR